VFGWVVVVPLGLLLPEGAVEPEVLPETAAFPEPDAAPDPEAVPNAPPPEAPAAPPPAAPPLAAAYPFDSSPERKTAVNNIMLLFIKPAFCKFSLDLCLY
jgi:hypothetical protein